MGKGQVLVGFYYLVVAINGSPGPNAGHKKGQTDKSA